MSENKKNIIYLKEEKNLMCIEGYHIDLNLVTHLQTNETNIILYFISGEPLHFSRPKANLSYKDVPKKYRDLQSYNEIHDIMSKLGAQFSYNDIYRDFSSRMGAFSYSDNLTCRIFNKYETDKKQKLLDALWDKLKNEIINRWSGIDNGVVKLIDYKVKDLIIKYYELNKNNPKVLINIEKIFGYKYADCFENLDIDGDYYVGQNGDIIKF